MPVVTGRAEGKGASGAGGRGEVGGAGSSMGLGEMGTKAVGKFTVEDVGGEGGMIGDGRRKEAKRAVRDGTSVGKKGIRDRGGGGGRSRGRSGGGTVTSH